MDHSSCYDHHPPPPSIHYLWVPLSRALSTCQAIGVSLMVLHGAVRELRSRPRRGGEEPWPASRCKSDRNCERKQAEQYFRLLAPSRAVAAAPGAKNFHAYSNVNTLRELCQLSLVHDRRPFFSLSDMCSRMHSAGSSLTKEWDVRPP